MSDVEDLLLIASDDYTDEDDDVDSLIEPNITTLDVEPPIVAAAAFVTAQTTDDKDTSGNNLQPDCIENNDSETSALNQTSVADIQPNEPDACKSNNTEATLVNFTASAPTTCALKSCSRPCEAQHKQHFLTHHVKPCWWLFDGKYGVRPKVFRDQIREDLNKFARIICPSTDDLDEEHLLSQLRISLNAQFDHHAIPVPCILGMRARLNMEQFSNDLGDAPPENVFYSIAPINSNACLMHWRVLAAILNRLPAEECERFKTSIADLRLIEIMRVRIVRGEIPSADLVEARKLTVGIVRPEMAPDALSAACLIHDCYQVEEHLSSIAQAAEPIKNSRKQRRKERYKIIMEKRKNTFDLKCQYPAPVGAMDVARNKKSRWALAAPVASTVATVNKRVQNVSKSAWTVALADKWTVALDEKWTVALDEKVIENEPFNPSYPSYGVFTAAEVARQSIPSLLGLDLPQPDYKLVLTPYKGAIPKYPHDKANYEGNKFYVNDSWSQPNHMFKSYSDTGYGSSEPNWTDNIPVTSLVTVVGGLKVYLDPKTYPDVNTLQRDSHWKMVVGCRPKKFRQLLVPSVMEKLKALINHPAVIAVGEIGLDRSVSLTDQDLLLQDNVFRDLLGLARVAGKPILLHLQGVHDQHLNQDVSFNALEKMRVETYKDIEIHFHSFCGSREVVQAWSHTRPNTLFGFTKACADFSEIQKDAVRAVRPDRLLLESMQFGSAGHPATTPDVISEIAVEIAKILGRTTEEVLHRTSANAQRLYGIKPLNH